MAEQAAHVDTSTSPQFCKVTGTRAESDQPGGSSQRVCYNLDFLSLCFPKKWGNTFHNQQGGLGGCCKCFDISR